MRPIIIKIGIKKHVMPVQPIQHHQRAVMKRNIVNVMPTIIRKTINVSAVRLIQHQRLAVRKVNTVNVMPIITKRMVSVLPVHMAHVHRQEAQKRASANKDLPLKRGIFFILFQMIIKQFKNNN